MRRSEFVEWLDEFLDGRLSPAEIGCVLTKARDVTVDAPHEINPLAYKGEREWNEPNA